MTELNTLFQIFNNLSESEKKAFLKKIKGENLPNITKASNITNICKCAHCNSAVTVIKPLLLRQIPFCLKLIIRMLYGENTSTA